MNKKPRIGILGGTFDPIHHGHLLGASLAYEKFGLDFVTFVPTARPPHKRKRSFAPAADRLEMVRLATVPDPRFRVSDLEQTARDFAYTYLTLQQVSRQHPGARLYFIIGEDNIDQIASWRRPDDIFNLATVVAVHRPGATIDRDRDEYGSRIKTCPGPGFAVSSSEIRRRVRAGKSIRYLVPPAVEQYIHAHKLYR